MPLKLHRVFLSHKILGYLHPNSSFTNTSMQDSYQMVLSFMQVVIETTRKFATLGPLELRPTFLTAENQELSKTGHISVLRSRHLSLKLVSLLNSPLRNLILIPKLKKWLAQFFTLLSYEPRCDPRDTSNLLESLQLKTYFFHFDEDIFPRDSAIRERIWLQALNRMASVWQRQESLASTLRFTQRKITGIAILTPLGG